MFGQKPIHCQYYDHISPLISGVFTGTEEDWQRHLYDTWFGMYDRARAILGSSGFEHVFIGEIKNGVVSGFHNWFHWYMLEKAGELNYLGYWETAEFGPDMEVEILMAKKDRESDIFLARRWHLLHLHLEWNTEALWVHVLGHLPGAGDGAVHHLPDDQVGVASVQL